MCGSIIGVRLITFDREWFDGRVHSAKAGNDRAAYDREYNEKNREKVRARQRKWYLENRQKVISRVAAAKKRRAA